MFSFCKKKKEVELKWSWSNLFEEDDVMSNLPKDEADDMFQKFLEPATPKSSCWWSDMKSGKSPKAKINDIIKQLEHALKDKDEIEELEDKVEYHRTAKACPAIISIFKNCYILKWPVDVMISIDDKGNLVTSSPQSSFIKISQHGPHQFRTNNKESDLFSNHCNVKIEFPFQLSSPDNAWMFLPSTWHKLYDFIVPPGRIEAPFASCSPLNINTMFPLAKDGELRTYHFKAGDPFAYLYFEKPITKQTFVDYPLNRWKFFTKGFIGRMDLYSD